ncbi:PE family protein, partial [Mycobacterium sp.]|uniref:PE family protein n=1 Tax=Mycobacterium sp. TaxID=1785 RepID=UPI0025FAAFAF
MPFLIAVPELIADVAKDLANIGSMVGSANNAVAPATTGLLPAAADEVSTQIAALFSTHAAGYQKLSAQAAAFHQQFVQNLSAGAGTYAAAEANAVQTLAAEAPSPGARLSGGLAGLGATLSADLAGVEASLSVSGIRGGLNAGLPGLPGNLAQLQVMETTFNNAVLTSELNVNASVVGAETALETSLFGGTGALGGVIDNFYNFWNAVLGTGEATFDSLLGVPFPSAFLAAHLVVGAPGVAIGGGGLGGLMGAVDTKFLWDLGVIGVPTAVTGGVVAGLPALGAGLLAAPVAGLQAIATLQAGALANFVTAETTFNANLLNNELALEASVFGPNAFNGALDRMFNVGNLALLTSEQ